MCQSHRKGLLHLQSKPLVRQSLRPASQSRARHFVYQAHRTISFPPTPPVISSSALASSSAWKESALVIRAINFNENLDSRCPNPLLQTTIFRNRRRLNPALLRLSRDSEEGGMMTVARDKTSTNRSRRLPLKKGILRQGLH